MVPIAAFTSLFLSLDAGVCASSSERCRLWARLRDLSLALSRDLSFTLSGDLSLDRSHDRALARSRDLSLDLVAFFKNVFRVVSGSLSWP